MVIASFWLALSVEAVELKVIVKNIQSNEGMIGCSLFADAAGYPMDSFKAKQARWQKARTEGVVFRFEALKPGTYAVAVSHDLNGNKKTDTNFFGAQKRPGECPTAFAHHCVP